MNEKIIEFYKDLGFTGKRMYNYLDKITTYVDFSNLSDDKRSFIECRYEIKDNILKRIKLILPVCHTLEDTVMTVHELGHFFQLYPYLNKDISISEGCEIFPIAMERLFVENTNNSEVINWFNNYQYNLIDECLKHENIENVVGFLNHWDFIGFYKENNSLPELLDFKTHDYINPYVKLEEKAKKLLKSI